MRISIRHQLTVAIGEDAPRAVMHLLLTPQSSNSQTVEVWELDAPGMDEADGFVDAYGNRAHLATQTKPDPELTVTASGVVVTHDRSGVVGRLELDPVPTVFTRPTPLTKPIGAITTKFRSVPAFGQERIALLHDLMDRVTEVIGERPEQSQSQSQDGQSQSQSQSSGEPEGEMLPAVAADYAHAFIGAARAIGYPARFVTGYLSGDGDSEAAFHAWAEAWDDGLGWIGFDAVLGECPAERHVRVACGLDAASVPPVRSVPMIGLPTAQVVEVQAEQ